MSLYSALTQVLAPFAAKIKGIQTGYDGTEYDSPGEAVREQINDLHVLIGHVPGQAIDASAVAYGNSDVGTELDGVNGRLQQLGEEETGVNKLNSATVIVGNIGTNGAVDESVTTRYTSDFIPCTGGDTLYFTCINGRGNFMGISAVSPLVVAFYDGNKDFITGSRQTSVNSITVPSTAEYVRITGSDGQIHSGIGSVTFNTYPTKTSEFQLFEQKFVLFVQAQIDANTRRLNGGFDDKIIDCWGDSRTAMIASQGTSYCDYLQTLLGDTYNVCNYGESSQSSGMCNARLGGNEVFVTLTNNQIPASGEVQLTAIKCSKGNNRNLYAYSATSYIPCLLNGVRGRLSRASISDFSKVKFIRDSDGSAISVNPRTKIVVTDMGSRKHPCVLWWGKNDFSSAASYVVDGVLANYASAVEYLGHDKYVILGETCSVKSSYDEGGADRVKLESINSELARLYPNNYIDINAWLSSEDALTSVGLTATATDLEYIAKGWPCYQLMKYSTDTSDDVHPNEKGREAIANRIYAWMQEKGW